MAYRVQPIIIGADVSSRSIDLAWHGDPQAATTIDNTATAIDAWLDQQSAPVCLAVESTGSYHIELVERAHAQGLTVYLVNPFQLAHYRKGVGVRSKTDLADAQLLARYLAHERDQLRAWQPPPKGQRRAWQLLRRRAKLVKARDMLNQSFSGLRGFRQEYQALCRQLRQLEQALEKQLIQLLTRQGWKQDYGRCLSIPGIGPLSAAALVAAYHRGEFRCADAFVAFLGLDIRLRQSGKSQGRSKLTKQGDPEARRILHNAAVTAGRHHFKPYYERLLARGMAPVQAHVALTRKLVRIAFSLIRNGREFDPEMAPVA